MARTKQTARRPAPRQPTDTALKAAAAAILSAAPAPTRSTKSAATKRATPKVGVGKTTGRAPRPPARVPATIQDADDSGAASAPRAEPATPWVSPSAAFIKLWDAFDTWEKFCALAPSSEHAEAKLLINHCLRASGFPRKRVAFFEMNKFRADYGTPAVP